jgi:hypothetical protein
MTRTQSEPLPCVVCGRTFPRGRVVPAVLVRPTVAETIQRDHPDWSAERFICREDLRRHRGLYVEHRADEWGFCARPG